MKTLIILFLFFVQVCGIYSQTVKVGAKHFNEGYILGEILSQLIESKGFKVDRRFNLGGTLICYEALINKEIDVYPEYTGTISEAILKLKDKPDITILKSKINEIGLDISESYGFNNTYAFALKNSLSEKLNLKTISDLKLHPELKIGLSYEFLNREDGWINLSEVYGLPQIPAGMEHGLAYKALDDGQIQITDVYSTDGEIPKYDLRILADDKNFFPDYYAVSFYDLNINADLKNILKSLDNNITAGEMQKMNAEVLYENKTFAETASGFLKKKKLFSGQPDQEDRKDKSLFAEIFPKLIQHIKLTSVALFLALIIAVPAGIIIYKIPVISKPVLYLTGLLQTIPSIALLAVMIPVFGIGVLPAVVALFLYGLLPIMRSTAVSLFSVDPLLKEVATGIGLTDYEKLMKIELPLSMPNILAGIRTAAVINIGTATLAAFIGAGGLGEFIVTGLALNNTKLILTGAIPAALLAVVTEILFELLEKYLIPKHLIQKK